MAVIDKVVFVRNAIHEHLSELEFSFSESTHCVLGERCKGSINSNETVFGPLTGSQEAQGGSQGSTERLRSESSGDMPKHDRTIQKSRRYSAPLEDQLHSPAALQNLPDPPAQCTQSNDLGCKHEISDDLLSQKEAITHLRAFLSFMKEEMREIFARHQLLRSCEAGTIAFQDLWHLFMAGDLVVTDDESNPKIYRVSILPAGDPFSSRKPVEKIKLRSDGSHKQVESVYKAESISVLNVDLFYFDFDGQNFGPVETRFTVVSYEGEKNITDLPLYPIRFRKDAGALQTKILQRGANFCELSKIAHREYNGLSVVEPEEQVILSACVPTSFIYS